MASANDAYQRRHGIRGVEPRCRGWEEARAAVAASMESLGAVLVVQDALISARTSAGPCSAALAGALRAPAGRQAGACLRARQRVHRAEARRAGVRERAHLGDHQRRRCPERRRPPAAARRHPSFCDAVSTFATNMLGLHRKLEAMIWRAWASATERRLPPRLAQLQPPAVALRGVEAPPATACSWRRTGTIHRAVRGRAARRRGPRGAGQGRRELARGGPQAGHRVTVAVIAGELLAVVTRVLACLHRVSAPGGRERLSAQFVSKPKDSHTVRPLDELVDGDHPPLYKPCDFDGYVRFRFAGDGRKLSDPLEAFGVAKDE